MLHQPNCSGHSLRTCVCRGSSPPRHPPGKFPAAPRRGVPLHAARHPYCDRGRRGKRGSASAASGPSTTFVLCQQPLETARLRDLRRTELLLPHSGRSSGSCAPSSGRRRKKRCGEHRLALQRGPSRGQAKSLAGTIEWSCSWGPAKTIFRRWWSPYVKTRYNNNDNNVNVKAHVCRR